MSEVRYGRFFLITVIMILTAVVQSEAAVNVNPTNNAVVTSFTNAHVTGLDGTRVDLLSTSNFVVYYAVANTADSNSWDGAAAYWLPWATNSSMGRDLSGYTSFVFGVRGLAAQVKVEFESSDGLKTLAYLNKVTNTLQYYRIPSSGITNNLAKMKSINFIAYYAGVGVNKTGTFEVVVQGLVSTDWEIYPVSTGAVTRLPFTTNLARVSDVDRTPWTMSTLNSTNFLTVQYKLAPADSISNGNWYGSSPDWDAAMVYWFPWATNSSMGYNLSSVTTFVFGVRSTSMAQRVKVEFESSDTNKTIAVLRNIAEYVAVLSYPLF